MENAGHHVERIVTNISNLPSLPFIADKIVSITENRNATAKDIADVITVDQSLAAKLLKLVNSSFYGFSSKISTISRAVVVLGFRTIKTLALGVTVFKAAKSIEGKSIGLEMEKFWEHSVGVGAGAKLIARLTGYKLSEEAFLAGLLHDIGKIIFNQYLPEEFNKALVTAQTEDISLIEAEQRILRVDHEVAGDYLAEKWKLPYPIRQCISRHHNPPFKDKFFDPEILKLISIVSVSNTLCKMRKIGFSGNTKLTPKDESVMQWLEIEESEIERFFLEIDSELVKAKEFLGIVDEEDEEADLAGFSEKFSVLLVYKNRKRILMDSLFLKSLNLDCYEVNVKDDPFSVCKNRNFAVVFTDELSVSEVSQLKEIMVQSKQDALLYELPVPFNSTKLLSLLPVVSKKDIPVVEVEGKSKSILIVCDENHKDEGVRLKSELNHSSLEVRVLLNPEKTIVYIKDRVPDVLILMDIKLGNISSFSLIPLLKHFLNMESKYPKMILLSPFIHESVLKKLQSFQLDLIVQRPYQPNDLVSRVYAFLNM